jgi:hypothetical protein
MKMLLAIAALLVTSLAFADTVTLNPVPCTPVGVCANPAPNVSTISFSPYNGTVSATIGGKVYTNQVVYEIAPVFAINAVLYATDGSHVDLSAAFQHWTTRTVSGRGQMIVQHYSLLGGTLQ